MNSPTNRITILAASLLLLATVNWTYGADPVAAAAHGNKGNELAQTAKYDEAIVEFAKAIELSPSDPRLYNDRGRVYRAMAKYPEAMADFDKAITLAPKSETGYIERGQTQMSQNKFDEALADYNKAIELAPTNP